MYRSEMPAYVPVVGGERFTAPLMLMMSEFDLARAACVRVEYREAIGEYGSLSQSARFRAHLLIVSV
jgi:hypothetical protein